MSILHMSLYGAVMIIAIFLIRSLFFNKLPKQTFIVLWGIACVRLIVPFSFKFDFNIYSLIDRGFPEAITAISTADKIVSPTRLIHESIDIVTSFSFRNVNLWNVVWILGMILFLSVSLASYFRRVKELRASLPADSEMIGKWMKTDLQEVKCDIRISDRIASPLVYGIFHPTILLPQNMNFLDGKSLEYILIHEITHVKRFDLIKKAILTLVLCLHWFNPLVWLMCILANRDIEIACDENVINNIGDKFKGSYALTLLDMVEGKSKLNMFQSDFSRYSIKERVESIMKMKKRSFLWTFLAILIVLGTTSVFAASIDTLKLPYNQAIEDGVNIILEDNEIYMNNFQNMYLNPHAGKEFAPKFEGVYCVVLLLNEEDYKTIEKVRFNYNGDWINEAEFRAMYPRYTFDVFDTYVESAREFQSSLLKTFLQLIKESNPEYKLEIDEVKLKFYLPS